MKRRVISFLLVLAMALTFAGCGSSEKKSDAKDRSKKVAAKDRDDDGDDRGVGGKGDEDDGRGDDDGKGDDNGKGGGSGQDQKPGFHSLGLSEKYLVGFEYSTNDIYEVDPYVTVKFRKDGKVEMVDRVAIDKGGEARVREFDLTDEAYEALEQAIDLYKLYTLDPEEMDPDEVMDGGYSHIYMYGENDQVVYAAGGFCPRNKTFLNMYSALYDALPQELLDAYEELKIHQEFSWKSLYGGYGVFLNEETDWNLVRDYGVIVVDAQFLSAEDIKKLREQGNEFILSYINVGSLEEFRPYYEEFADLALGEYEHWEDEQWVDAGSEKWQAFILETLAPELLAKGIDGFFVDNCDVYCQFPTDEILQGLADMMRGLVATGKQVIINGGDVFLDAYTEKLGEWYDVVTGINQEMVFTWMDYDNNMVRARIMDCDEMKYYKAYIEKYAAMGADVFLLEYSDNAGIVERVEKYCREKRFVYYISDSLELDG